MNSIRVVLVVIVAKGYVSEQMEVDTPFLNSNLKEKVYMEVPPRLSATKCMLFKLKKAFYGHKQAPSAWHKTFMH